MIVLAIDTAGIDCSAALYDAEARRLLSAVSEEIGKGHAERSMGVIDAALDAAHLSLDAVGRIAVVVGPGSFTGIRVGVAAARGLALALGAECVGVTTLETLAQARLAKGANRPVLAAMDAKREEIYAQAFDISGAPLTEPEAMSAQKVAEVAERLGAELTGSWAERLAGSGDGTAQIVDRYDIGIVAQLGAAKAVGTRPKPLYLRGPDAKPQTGFALARS